MGKQEDRGWIVEIFDSIRDISGKLFRHLKQDSVSIPNLYEQVWSKLMELPDWVWLLDLYVEESTNQIFAIVSREGLIYRAEVTIQNNGITVGELIQVKEVFEPVSNSLLIRRQADGSSRWFLIASSSVLNRSASIDSTKLFDNLVKRSEDSGKYPYLTYYHLGETLKMGMTDWTARADNLLLASGTFEKDNVLAECMQRAYSDNPEYWGASISFWPLDGHMEEIAEGISVPMYTDGEFEEISILAEKDANCLFTALHSKGKVTQMKDELIAQIKLLTGQDEELANKIIAQVDASNKQIVDNGLIARQAPTPDPVPEKDEDEGKKEEEESAEEPKADPVEDSKPAPESESKVIEIDEELATSIADLVVKNPAIAEALKPVADLVKSFQTFQETVNREIADLRSATKREGDLVTERLQKLELDEEKKREDWLNDAPKNSKVEIRYRPRKNSTESKDPKDEESFDEIANKTVANLK